MKLKLKNKDTVIIFVLVVLIIITKFGLALNKKDIEINLNDNQSTIKVELEENILVHISGEVKIPGVYELKSNERLDDLVKIAGGLTEDADESRINLARSLEDGLKIHIPNMTVDVNQQGNDKFTLTDFNQLNQEKLEEIDGIGKVISERIINYRETNGPFTKISDLLEVNGIGESKLEKIKSKVY